MKFPATSPPVPDLTGARWFIWSFILSVVTLLVFPCICGHLHTEALPTSGLGVVLAWYPFIRYERARILDRCVAVFFVLFTSLVFLKNVADVLWFGHEPLFQ